MTIRALTLIKPVLLPAIALMMLAACSDESDKAADAAVPEPSREQIIAAENALPASADLAEKYERSCMACHTIPETNAPLTGYSAAWQPRLEDKGMDGLLNAAKTGMNDNVMPAMGLCMDCSDDDLVALINFMMTDAMQGAN